MADTTPRLYSSPADPRAEYAPVSWMAATALFVAVSFTLILLVLVRYAFLSNEPLIASWLFIFPILGLVMAFAGRRHIRNSEGTRTGLTLATTAWWICVVTGLAYGAYVLATEYTVQADTEKQFGAWAENLKKIEPQTANDPALASAFYQTLPPSQRVAFSATNTTAMQDRFGQDFVTFRQNKLSMIIQRNPGQCELVPQRLKQWQQSPGKIECALAAILRCPEGEFAMVIPMEATIDKGKRDWQIKSFDGYVQDAPGTKRTPYGWNVEWLDYTGKAAADNFLKVAGSFPDAILAQPVAFEIYHTGSIAPLDGSRIIATASDRAMLTGVLGLIWPTSPAYAQALVGGFFVQTPLPDGKMTPDANAKEDFAFCWSNIAYDKITMAGRTLSASTDKNCSMRFYPDRVELAVPIELKTIKSDPKNSAALGRMILTLDDKTILAELATTRDEGLKGARTGDIPAELQKKTCPWKVTRIESNLKVIRAAPPAGAGGQGGQ